mmetsp:Transcript_93147/g.234088  ORF Transcript_93147/g.234088 Transcript_93147/m.234088 type:complete len:310 (+) Transcript_93147:513-1442(+)
MLQFGPQVNAHVVPVHHRRLRLGVHHGSLPRDGDFDVRGLCLLHEFGPLEHHRRRGHPERDEVSRRGPIRLPDAYGGANPQRDRAPPRFLPCGRPQMHDRHQLATLGEWPQRHEHGGQRGVCTGLPARAPQWPPGVQSGPGHEKRTERLQAGSGLARGGRDGHLGDILPRRPAHLVRRPGLRLRRSVEGDAGSAAGTFPAQRALAPRCQQRQRHRAARRLEVSQAVEDVTAAHGDRRGRRSSHLQPLRPDVGGSRHADLPGQVPRGARARAPAGGAEGRPHMGDGGAPGESAGSPPRCSIGVFKSESKP